MTCPILSRLEQELAERFRNTAPPLAIEPIASEGNPWNGPYEKAPLPIYPNMEDFP